MSRGEISLQASGRATTDPAGGGFTVTTPDGQVFTFPTQAKAEAFKREAGIP